MTNTPQGLIAPAILVPATALNDANRGWLVDEVASFAIWAESEAMLVLGEYPIEAQWANACLYYIGQVENGGHGQFASNSDMRAVTISGIDKALAASGYGELHAIFRDFQALMEAPKVRQRAMETAGFEGTPDALKVLDRRYFALGDADTKVRHLSEWTASLPTLKPLPKERLDAERAAVIAANKRSQARRDERARAVAEHEANDPRRQAASALCNAVGEEFKRFTGGNPLPGGSILWLFETSTGKAGMVVGTGKALLLDAALKPRDVFCDWPYEPGGRVFDLRRPTDFSAMLHLFKSWFRRWL